MSTEERIAVLELQYRNMKRIVLGISAVISLNFAICALIIVGFFVSAASAPDVIQAKMFELVNDEGKVIVELSNLRVGGVDNGMLVTRNSAGEALVQLSAGPGGGRLE